MQHPFRSTSFWPRLADALRRRTRYWSRRWQARPAAPVEAAVDWLLRPQPGPWLPRVAGQSVGDPATTRLAIDALGTLGVESPLAAWSAWLRTVPTPTQPATDTLLSQLDRAAEFPTALVADGCRILLDQGLEQPAREVLRKLVSLQHRDGSLPAQPDGRRVCSVALAQVAALWSRVGETMAAGRAIDCLLNHQNRSGGFPGAWGPAAGAARHEEPTRAVVYLLDAVRRQVTDAFGPEATTVPDAIDPADGRVALVRRWLAQLASDTHVADLGCGKGRYERLLGAEFPLLRFTGVDASPAMLACLPPGVVARQGSLLRIPLPDAACDAAFAIESLEHALLPARAVDEMARIVRPGGRLLVIDKHRRKQPLSRHDPWERWFLPAELAGWLARWCDDVRVEPVAHREGRPASDLFLAATGTRKG